MSISYQPSVVFLSVLPKDLDNRANWWKFKRPLRSGDAMPKYIIEREIPNAGALSMSELQAIAQRSCSVLQQLGPSIQWVQSYVTENKITCVYIAPNAEIIREHAKLGGFPANRVLEVGVVIDPTTSETNELAEVATS
jgi:hypothetical protein